APPRTVVPELAAAADRGIVAEPGGRYFGFVIGGAVPAALAADWLATAWDQNAGLYVTSPAAAVVEEVAGAWLKELLGLPAQASFGFVTGGQMANTTALAAARNHVLAHAGWDVEADGLQGAPRVRVVVGAQRHGTIDRALRLLVRGVERAGAWATDAHKWLNVPYDCGVMFSAHPEAHSGAMSDRAAYLVYDADTRDQMDWNPESSRRARGFAVYAAIRSLGRAGIAELVERCCAHARALADGLRALGAEILNDVVLNQVLVGFATAEG